MPKAASKQHLDSLDQVYLVGGAVRDQLLGLKVHDKDYVVVGSSIENMLAQGYVSVGKDFPVFLHPKTKQEYALARTERKTGAGYTGFSVDASQHVTLEQDLARRDLTINAMAMTQDGTLIDPFNGQADLANKVLKHTTTAFQEDPVRVLRLARFFARFGKQWRIHEDTKDLVKQMHMAGELSHLVAERVWKETEKALGEREPQLYFEALQELGVLTLLFPELADMVDVPQPPVHHPEGDVFTHTMLVLKRAAQLGFDLPVRFAALTHDFGKAHSYRTKGNLHGHESAGIAIIEAFCERLRIPSKLRDIGVLTSENHLLSHRFFELTAKTVQTLIIKRFDALKQPQRFEYFLQACQCDAQGRGPALVNKPYPQYDYGLYLLNQLVQIDTKKVVQEAIHAGLSGPAIGEQVQKAHIRLIDQAIKAHKKG